MQLNKFKAVAKPRNPWQAIDLGFVMARAWYWQLLLLWLVPAGILYTILALAFYDKPMVSALVVWWLKPVWERPLLHVISRQLFDNQVAKKDVFRQYFKLIKFDLLLWLSWRRFSVYRGFDMPVTQLEQLKGSDRRSRLHLLHMRFGGAASWLLITCVHVELFLLFGIGAGFALLIPQGVDPDWSLWLMNNSELVTHLYNFLWMISAALVAPFYVCAGFSLYLQRRIDLEAWDIEIQFRRLAQRTSERRQKMTLPLALVAAATFSVLSSYSPPLEAQTETDSLSAITQDESFVDEAEQPESPEKKAAKEAINAIFDSADFQNIDKRSGFRPIAEDEESDEIPEWLISLAEWFEKGGAFFSAIGQFFLWVAKFIEVILWVLVISLLAFIIYYYRSFIKRVFNIEQDEKLAAAPPPKTLFGLDVSEESLPEDVVDAAQKSWAEGNQRQALAWLVRGSIVKCIEKGCDFASGNTEKECAQIVRRSLQKHYGEYFSTLVKHWQARAYAHRECTPETFELLCTQWRKVFAHE